MGRVARQEPDRGAVGPRETSGTVRGRSIVTGSEEDESSEEYALHIAFRFFRSLRCLAASTVTPVMVTPRLRPHNG